MGNRVVGAVATVQLQLAGLVVHRVGVDVQAVGLLAQRVDERIADTTHTCWLIGAAREDDLGVGAVGGRRHRQRGWGDEQDADG